MRGVARPGWGPPAPRAAIGCLDRGAIGLANRLADVLADANRAGLAWEHQAEALGLVVGHLMLLGHGDRRRRRWAAVRFGQIADQLAQELEATAAQRRIRLVRPPGAWGVRIRLADGRGGGGHERRYG